MEDLAGNDCDSLEESWSNHREPPLDIQRMWMLRKVADRYEKGTWGEPGVLAASSCLMLDFRSRMQVWSNIHGFYQASHRSVHSVRLQRRQLDFWFGACMGVHTGKVKSAASWALVWRFLTGSSGVVLAVGASFWALQAVGISWRVTLEGWRQVIHSMWYSAILSIPWSFIRREDLQTFLVTLARRKQSFAC